MKIIVALFILIKNVLGQETLEAQHGTGETQGKPVQEYLSCSCYMTEVMLKAV